MRPHDSDPTLYKPGSYDHEFDTPLDDSIFEEQLPLASPWVRLGALMLNYLITFGAALPGIAVAILGEETGSDELVALGAIVAVLMVAGLTIYQMILLSKQGQSIGKRILNIRIVDARDETNPGFARVILLRGVVIGVLGSIPFIGTVFSLADGAMVFSEDHQTIHDRIASTVVVTEKGIY